MEAQSSKEGSFFSYLGALFCGFTSRKQGYMLDIQEDLKLEQNALNSKVISLIESLLISLEAKMSRAGPRPNLGLRKNHFQKSK